LPLRRRGQADVASSMAPSSRYRRNCRAYARGWRRSGAGRNFPPPPLPDRPPRTRPPPAHKKESRGRDRACRRDRVAVGVLGGLAESSSATLSAPARAKAGREPWCTA
jgi:hypothetical protein